MSGRTSPVAHAVHQHLVLPAVDLDHRAVDEEREVGGEKSDEIGDLLGFGDPPERNACRSELVRLFEREIYIARHRFNEAGPSRGAHRSGIDGDEADIVLAVLAGERFGQICPAVDGAPGAISQYETLTPSLPIRFTTRPFFCFCMIGNACFMQRT